MKFGVEQGNEKISRHNNFGPFQAAIPLEMDGFGSIDSNCDWMKSKSDENLADFTIEKAVEYYKTINANPNENKSVQKVIK